MVITNVRSVLSVRPRITCSFYALRLGWCGGLLGQSSQYYSWCYVFLPGGSKFYTFGLVVVCWAI